METTNKLQGVNHRSQIITNDNILIYFIYKNAVIISRNTQWDTSDVLQKWTFVGLDFTNLALFLHLGHFSKERNSNLENQLNQTSEQAHDGEIYMQHLQ